MFPDEEPGASRKLIVPAGPSARFVVLKDADVPLYVERGAADLGVCGLDQVLESGADLLTPIDFGFGRCRLCLAARAESVLRSSGARCGWRRSSAPDLAVGSSGAASPVDLVPLAGSVELAR